MNNVAGTYLAQSVSVKVTEGKERSLRLSILSDGKWVREPGRLVRQTSRAFWSTATSGSSIKGRQGVGPQVPDIARHQGGQEPSAHTRRSANVCGRVEPSRGPGERAWG